MPVRTGPAGNRMDIFVIFVNVMRRLLSFFLTILAVSSCATSVPDFSQLSTPEFAAVTATSVSEDGATLIATVTGSTQVSNCGFVISLSGEDEKTEHSARMDGDIFTCSLSGLQPSSTYDFTAFVRNGAGMRLDSPVRSFTTLESQKPPQDDDPDNPGQPQQPDDPQQPGSTVEVPDAQFLSWLLWFFDADGDGSLSTSEAAIITTIEINTDAIRSVAPLEAFPELVKLHAAGGFKDDESLGQLTKIDAKKCCKLSHLYAPHNKISTVILPEDTGALDRFEVSYNALESVDLRAYKALTLVQLDHNRFTSLNLSGLDRLDELHVDCNPLKTITLDNKLLRYIDIHGTELTTVDFSRCPKLNVADCSGCPFLKTIVLAPGQVLSTLRTDDGVTIIRND